MPGTREFHCFIPTGDKELNVKRISADNSSIQTTVFIQTAHAEKAPSVRFSDLDIGKYIGCTYDEKWWVGYILDKSEEENDLLVKFMHPHGPFISFHWPSREDKCWVPTQCVLCIIRVPTTSNGRQYHLHAHDEAFLTRK